MELFLIICIENHSCPEKMSIWYFVSACNLNSQVDSFWVGVCVWATKWKKKMEELLMVFSEKKDGVERQKAETM